MPWVGFSSLSCYSFSMLNLLFRLFGGVGKQTKTMQREFTKQLLKLVTSGFGLVAALAWNELIKKVVADYIKPKVGGDYEIISLIIYALVVTLLAVVVTLNLSRLTGKTKED